MARIETMNRLLYLGGVAAGIVLALIVGFIVFVVNDRSSDVFGDEIDATSLIVLVPLLASAGSLASVLSRLDTITELRNDAGWRRVCISGFSKPVVAALFATVVAIIIDSKVVDFGIDSDGVTPKQVEITAVASFLCGYTERFGIDVLSSVPFPGNKQG